MGAYWYPYPPSYGWGFGFTVGIFWGFGMSGGWGHPCFHGGGGVDVNHRTNINNDNSYGRWGNRPQAGPLPSNPGRQAREPTFAQQTGRKAHAGQRAPG